MLFRYIGMFYYNQKLISALNNFSSFGINFFGFSYITTGYALSKTMVQASNPKVEDSSVGK